MPKVSGDLLGSKPDQGPILPGGASDNRPLITEKIKFNFISNRCCHAILDNGDACPGHPKGHYIYIVMLTGLYIIGLTFLRIVMVGQ